MQWQQQNKDEKEDSNSGGYLEHLLSWIDGSFRSCKADVLGTQLMILSCKLKQVVNDQSYLQSMVLCSNFIDRIVSVHGISVEKHQRRSCFKGWHRNRHST